MTMEYRRRAEFQRRLLLGMNLFQMVIGLVLIANVIHHW